MRRRTPGDQRTLDEVVYRYRLEPMLKDIWVEGSSDAALIDWFLDHHQRRGWQVFPINTVDVPTGLVLAAGYDNGERGRVLTLCRAVCEALAGAGAARPIFIADRDFDALDDAPTVPCDLCLMTDFTSMEMYAFNPRMLQKFLRLYVQTFRVRGEQLHDELVPALVDLFMIRTVLYRRNEGIGLVSDVTRFCALQSETVSVRTEELVQESLNAAYGRNRPASANIIVQVGALRAVIPEDPRMAMHGRDFVRLLKWRLEGHNLPTALLSVENFKRALLLALEAEDLASYPLFEELLNRTAA